ncbi:hypothetical protein LZ31DRAFT_347528 [Colletotrichum somersetense]|nr:hypothetical protein LZ31DRAFT_347528 [Colletotrichum somersetense]
MTAVAASFPPAVPKQLGGRSSTRLAKSNDIAGQAKTFESPHSPVNGDDVWRATVVTFPQCRFDRCMGGAVKHSLAGGRVGLWAGYGQSVRTARTCVRRPRAPQEGGPEGEHRPRCRDGSQLSSNKDAGDCNRYTWDHSLDWQAWEESVPCSVICGYRYLGHRRVCVGPVPGGGNWRRFN